LSYGQYRFRTLNIEDGLSENSITDTFEDSDGFIWFGTQDGISRYDGYTMKNFNMTGDDSTSLSDNFLWSFDEDSLGFIWCCSRNG
jgi:ligand-binding sensor domain-containing protein